MNMRTWADLRTVIDYQQTEVVFRGFLQQLREAGVLKVHEDEIDREDVSASLFAAVLDLYGVSDEG